MAGSDIQQDGSSFPGSSQVTLIPPTQDDRGSTANGNLQVPTNQGNPEHNNPFVHSETQTTPTELSFAEKLQKQKDDLNAGYIEFEENLKTRNTKEDDMTELDWDRLQAEYEREVSSIALQERELIEQFDARFKQFMLWMQVSDERESERAKKRLKTQAALVQHSEQQLRNQEVHYDQVMQAFSGAMSLLQQRDSPS